MLCRGGVGARAVLAGAPGPVGGGLSPHQPGPVTLSLAFLTRLRMGALGTAVVPPHRTVWLATSGTGLKSHLLVLSIPQVYRRLWGPTGKSRGAPGKGWA